jgi:hypothetical protein
MSDPIEPLPDDHPSLVENVTHHRPRHGRTIALIGALAVLAAGLTFAAHATRKQADALRLQSAAAAASEAAARADAEGQGVVPISVTLDALSQHLPAAVSLVSAEGRPGGTIRIAIDTPDPDLLRQALAADPWFDRFRERGQEQHDDGSFRVTLESR